MNVLLAAALATFTLAVPARLPQEHGPMILFPPFRGPAIPAYPWRTLATCESGEQWGVKSLNGFYGGLQVSSDFWDEFKPPGAPAYANEATPAQQVYAARRIAFYFNLKQMWHYCGRYLP